MKGKFKDLRNFILESNARLLLRDFFKLIYKVKDESVRVDYVN